MRHSPIDMVFAYGLPGGDQDDLAESLREKGWHREDFSDRFLSTTQDLRINSLLGWRARQAWGENLSASGYSALAAMAEPSAEAQDDFVWRERVKHCLSAAKTNIGLASNYGLRSVLNDHVMKRDDRKRALAVLRERAPEEGLRITAVQIETPVEHCIGRFRRTLQDHGILYAERITPDSLADGFDPIGDDEGFDQVLHVGPGEDALKRLHEAGVDLTRRRFMDWLRKNMVAPYLHQT